MLYCIKCNKEFESDLVDTTKFKFVGNSPPKIVYNQRCDCGGRLVAGFAKDKFINIGLGGDTPGFYSPDLGMYIKSPSHLKRVLKKRKMVCLTDSREKRDYDTEMLDRARAGEFDK